MNLEMDTRGRVWVYEEETSELEREAERTKLYFLEPLNKI
jgi:hypothetical protein